MSAEGWICPLCRCGVAPYELRCPCAGQQGFGGAPLPWAPLPWPPYPRPVQLDPSITTEPPFDWMAAIDNVHVGPMVEVVDGEARAIAPK